MEDKLLPCPLHFLPVLGEASCGLRQILFLSGPHFLHLLSRVHTPRVPSLPRESFVELSNEMQGNRRDWLFPPGTGFT